MSGQIESEIALLAVVFAPFIFANRREIKAWWRRTGC